MMNHPFHDLLNDAVDADAAGTDGSRFADAHGSVVTGRVRRRRAVRSAGMGSVAAVSVGAVALGASQVPWGSWASLTPGGCPEGMVAMTASPVAMTASPVATPELPTPNITVVSDRETGNVEITVVREPHSLTTDSGVDESIVVEVRDDEVVQLATDGYHVLHQQDDGFYTVDLPGGNMVGFTVDRDSADQLIGVVSFDELVETGPTESATPEEGATVTCVTPSPTPDVTPSPTASPEPDASPSPAPSPEPSREPSIVASDVTSPYQCDFVFGDVVHADERWMITESKWMSPEDAWNAIDEQFLDSIDHLFMMPVDDVLYFGATGTLFSDSVARSFEGLGTWGDPADPGHGGLFARTPPAEHMELSIRSASVVATVDGRVVATITEESMSAGQPGKFFIDSYTGDAGMFLLDSSALMPCPGFAGDIDDTELYGVAGAGYRTADGSVVGPVYSWQNMERPQN